MFRGMASRLHFVALVPVLFSLTAFILSMLCIFAGSKTGYLESADLFTLNTSMLGQTFLSTQKVAATPKNSVGNNVHKEVNKAVGDAAKQLNIHDFYSAHILDYCEGDYSASTGSDSKSSPTKKVTFCSNQTAYFYFDPTSVIEKELKHGVNITDLKWPSAIQDAVRVLELSSKAMFFFYATGAAAAASALVGAMYGAVVGSKLSAFVNIIISVIAFFSLMVASAISTAIINQIVDAVNTYGHDVGVFATKGMTFIHMTWAATILVLISGFVWAFAFIKRRRGKVAYPMDQQDISE
ncbi:hypothetical protein ACLMJK_005097 [Lecanora helva]